MRGYSDNPSSESRLQKMVDTADISLRYIEVEVKTLRRRLTTSAKRNWVDEVQKIDKVAQEAYKKLRDGF